MAFTERTSISSTALSYLLFECVNSRNSQEGFLFGKVTQAVTNHISDTRTDNARVEVVIDVTSVFPAPDTGVFYHPSGEIKEDILENLLMDSSSEVVGWYRYRNNDSLKPTVRDRIISRGLQKYFANNNRGYFLCCNVAREQNQSNSTHTYSYRFSKVNKHGAMEPLPDVTSNLGETVSGYKRPSKSGQNDPFETGVKEACGGNGYNVAEAVRAVLAAAGEEAARREAAVREVALEVQQMSALLAERFRANACENRPARRTAARLLQEQAVIGPVVEAVTAPTREPFDFVNDLIKEDLHRRSSSISDAVAATIANIAENHLPEPTPRRISSATATSPEKVKPVHTRGWEKPALAPKPQKDI